MTRGHRENLAKQFPAISPPFLKASRGFFPFLSQSERGSLLGLSVRMEGAMSSIPSLNGSQGAHDIFLFSCKKNVNLCWEMISVWKSSTLWTRFSPQTSFLFSFVIFVVVFFFWPTNVHIFKISLSPNLQNHVLWTFLGKDSKYLPTLENE